MRSLAAAGCRGLRDLAGVDASAVDGAAAATVAAAKEEGRCIWAIFGDLKQAFPKSWRESILALLHTQAGIRDGAFALIANMLEWDEVLVALSGRSLVRVGQGIPEGGLLGPLFAPEA